MDSPRPTHHHRPGAKVQLEISRNRGHLIALEYDVVGLREAHDEHGVDDAEAHQVLGEHPVDHDHHGAHELEPATEEKEVEPVTEHDQLSHWVFQVVEAGKADWHTKLEKNAGEKEADSGRAECHVLHEDLPTKEGKLSDCLEDVEESHQNKGGFTTKPDLVDD